MTAPYAITVNRRTTLGWHAAAMAVSVAGMPLPLGARAQAAPTSETAPPPGVGYGKDPNLFDPHAPWPRILTTAQLRQTAALADIFLPKAGSYPAPSEVGIAEFVDEWVSAPYPDQVRDRALIFNGLAWLDSEAARLGQPDFCSLDIANQTKLLGQTAQLPTSGGLQGLQAMKLYGFFRRLRSVTVGAYYSLERNFAEIGYVGNVAMESFPPPTPEEDAFIDRAIAKLNL
jgi:Gluconate 2-dehydrogenase subunit 3